MHDSVINFSRLVRFLLPDVRLPATAEAAAAAAVAAAREQKQPRDPLSLLLSIIISGCLSLTRDLQATRAACEGEDAAAAAVDVRRRGSQ